MKANKLKILGTGAEWVADWDDGRNERQNPQTGGWGTGAQYVQYNLKY